MGRSSFVGFVMATCLGMALVMVKYEAQRRVEQLAALHRQFLSSQEAIHVLEAEWSYLNRPDRLEALVHRHLDLVPMDNRQISSVELLPVRLPALGDPGPRLDGGLTPTLASPPPLPVGRPLVLTGEVPACGAAARRKGVG